MEHHRCFKVYVRKTRSERVAGTIYFKHKTITNPTVTPEDAVVVGSPTSDINTKRKNGNGK